MQAAIFSKTSHQENSQNACASLWTGLQSGVEKLCSCIVTPHEGQSALVNAVCWLLVHYGLLHYLQMLEICLQYHNAHIHIVAQAVLHSFDDFSSW